MHRCGAESLKGVAWLVWALVHCARAALAHKHGCTARQGCVPPHRITQTRGEMRVCGAQGVMRVAWLQDGSAWALVQAPVLRALTGAQLPDVPVRHAALLCAYQRGRASLASVPDDGYIMQVRPEAGSRPKNGPQMVVTIAVLQVAIKRALLALILVMCGCTELHPQ